MAVNRSKAASGDIWDLVKTWYNDALVPYVAHAYLANGNVIQLRPPLSLAAGNRANNHSDQMYNEMVAHFSRHMRMVPGDVLATGTPPGVGMGKNRF